MCPPSELVDGLEPHDQFFTHGARVGGVAGSVHGGRGVPRVGAGGWVPEGTIPGTEPRSIFEAYLMNY